MNPPASADLTTCRCCGQPLDTFQQFSSIQGTCRTTGCDRLNITRELEVLAQLTDAEVERYLAAARRSAALV